MIETIRFSIRERKSLEIMRLTEELLVRERRQFIPGFSSSRTHFVEDKAETTLHALSQMSNKELENLEVSKAREMMEVLESNPEMNQQIQILKLVSKINFKEEVDKERTVNTSKDCIQAPPARRKMIISLVDEKRIKTLLGDITYKDTKTHTITMIELLYHHRELTIKLDLDVKPSLQILRKVAQGDLAKTITQFQKEQYNLEQVYSILQDAYQDMLTVDQAQKALNELVET